MTLNAGDVIGASVTGSGTRLRVFDPAQRLVIGSTQDASFIYPATTPLPGGGNAVLAHVADETGTYYIEVTGIPGDYDVTLQGFRPGPAARGVTQTIFLDFDGAQLNTAPFGGSGVRTLSPLSGFLGLWGLPASAEDALIDRVISTVTENLEQDFAGTGVQLNVLNSRDDPDPFGQPNVSRLIIGGTIAESGVNTIGIAQSIDPGNFDTAETRADPARRRLRPGDRPRVVQPLPRGGERPGAVRRHRAGEHRLPRGRPLARQLARRPVRRRAEPDGRRAATSPCCTGSGPDGVGGTADDVDVDFGEDTYNPFEGFTGIEDTAANTRAALLQGP